MVLNFPFVDELNYLRVTIPGADLGISIGGIQIATRTSYDLLDTIYLIRFPGNIGLLVKVSFHFLFFCFSSDYSKINKTSTDLK